MHRWRSFDSNCLLVLSCKGGIPAAHESMRAYPRACPQTDKVRCERSGQRVIEGDRSFCQRKFECGPDHLSRWTRNSTKGRDRPRAARHLVATHARPPRWRHLPSTHRHNMFEQHWVRHGYAALNWRSVVNRIQTHQGSSREKTAGISGQPCRNEGWPGTRRRLIQAHGKKRAVRTAPSAECCPQGPSTRGHRGANRPGDDRFQP